jgi:integrase
MSRYTSRNARRTEVFGRKRPPWGNRTKTLTKNAMTGIDICRMMTRRLQAAGLPGHFSPHSFRVTTVTDLIGAERAA